MRLPSRGMIHVISFFLLVAVPVQPTPAGLRPISMSNRSSSLSIPLSLGSFGASTVNIQQVWDKSKTMKIFQWATQSYSEDMDSFNAVVNELRDLAVRDLRLEGFTEDQIRFQLELEMRYGMQYNLTKILSPS